jgi:hypothetical protein
MAIKPHYIDRLHDELSQALGEAIWAFSMIEKLTYSYMKKLSTEPLDELMAGQNFVPRIRLVRRLVERLEGQDGSKETALQHLAEAEKLADIRNTLAHNPWKIWVDFEQSKFMSEIQKLTNENKRYDLELVRKFRDEAGELASNLENDLMLLHFPGR